MFSRNFLFKFTFSKQFRYQMDSNPNKRKIDEISKESSFFQDVKPALKQSKLNSFTKQVEPKSKPTVTYQSQKLLTQFIPVQRQFSTGDGKIPNDSVLISSWNINGLKRILTTKHLQNYFNTRKPDIICFNEVKASTETMEKEKLLSWVPSGYTCYFNPSKIRKAYSGVGIVTRYKPVSVKYGMGVDLHDVEGRLITLEFEAFYLVCVYVPFSGSEFKRLPYRINEWDPALRAYLSKLKETKYVVVCGDFNVAHQGLDMWEESGKYIGSSPPERNSFGKLLQAGFVDTFRYAHPEVRKYSWWNIWNGNKAKNRGRRFDYFLTSEEAAKGIKDAFISTEVNGSDHCPVELLFNPNFVSKKENKADENSSVIVID